MMPKRSTPKNCYWRGDILWGRIEVRGTEVRWSLRTADPREAARRVAERRKKEVSYAHFGERRFTYTEVATAWASWIAGQVAPPPRD
jgi:integrase/recombinase XerD